MLKYISITRILDMPGELALWPGELALFWPGELALMAGRISSLAGRISSLAGRIGYLAGELAPQPGELALLAGRISSVGRENYLSRPRELALSCNPSYREARTVGWTEV